MNLDEAIALVKACDNVEEVMEKSPQLLMFMNELNVSGTDIIRTMGAERAIGATGLIQVGVISFLLQDTLTRGDMEGILEVMNLSKSELFGHAIILAVKASIGLAALEELR